MSKAKLKFEDALKKLELIVEQLESGELNLEDALKQFEEGIRLAKLCGKQLESAEQKVRYLLEQSDEEQTGTTGPDKTEGAPKPSE